MYTLGINAAFHDSSACIIKDGSLLAAAEEERFTHIKHGKRPLPFSAWELPFHAIDYCLKIAGIHLREIDHIAYSFDPALASVQPNPAEPNKNLNTTLQNTDSAVYADWNVLFLSYIKSAPAQLVDGYPHHLQQRFEGASVNDFSWHFVPHHLSHAASAFLCSPYKEAAILTVDGRGEKTTTSYYIGNNNEMTCIGNVDMPHSLGMLYEKMTSYLGFLHSSDEYKVMALASYGEPVFVETFRSLIHVYKDGQYTIDEFDPAEKFGPARKRSDPFTQHHFNIAFGLQKALEETVLQLVQWLYARTGLDSLCMAGGVALNCVVNAVVRDKGPFKNIWVQPAAGDAGTALGAALHIDLCKRIGGHRNFYMTHPYWGPAYSDNEIEKFLQWTKVPYRRLDNVAAEAAAILADNKVIGWFQGNMEFGPRALGSRSILASPIDPGMQAILNEIKDREDFRPVAPVVLEEDAKEWFRGASFSPFMLFVYDVLPDKADLIPAVRHVDGTARIQTINRRQHKLYYDLIKEFKKITGVPVLVNTSFNTRGEPIVCTPRDAIECFWTSPFDALVINSFLLEKNNVSEHRDEVFSKFQKQPA
jgi:carbamoyltransferase